MDCSVPLNSITPVDLLSVTSTQISGAPLARPLTLDTGIIYSSCITQKTLTSSAIDSFSNYVSNCRGFLPIRYCELRDIASGSCVKDIINGFTEQVSHEVSFIDHNLSLSRTTLPPRLRAE